MITEEAFVDLREENDWLREQLASALQRIGELETVNAARNERQRTSRSSRKSEQRSASTRSGASARAKHTPRAAIPIPSGMNHVRAFTRRELERGPAPARRSSIQAQPVPPRLAPAPPIATRDVKHDQSAPAGATTQAPVIDLTEEQAERAHAAVASTKHEGVVGRATNNALMLLAGQLVTWGSTLILTAAYGRFLGAQGFGELYLATTFTSLVGFPIEYSFNQQIVRDVAQEPRSAHRYITMALTLKAALWLVLYGFALLLSIALGYSPVERWLIAICGLVLVTTAISSTLISIQTAYMQIGLAKFGVVLEKGLDCIIAIALLRMGAGVQTVALVLLFGSFVGMLWQISRVARIIGIRIAWDLSIAKALIRSGAAFLAYGVLGVIYYRIDTVLLSVFSNAAAVGVYGAAYRLLDTLMFVPSIIIGGVVSPILAKYSVDSVQKLRLTIEKSAMAMLLCSAPAAAGLIVAAPNIIGFVYHRHDFVGSEAVLQALAAGLVALYLNTVLTTVLVSTGHERKLPLMAAVALVFNVALNLALIPRFGGVGAAWATSLTEVLLLGVGAAMIDRSLIPARLWVTAGKILAATLVMSVVAYALTTFSILVIIPVAALTYAVAIWALRVLPSEDLAQLKASFARFAPPRFRRARPAAVLATTDADYATASESHNLEPVGMAS